MALTVTIFPPSTYGIWHQTRWMSTFRSSLYVIMLSQLFCPSFSSGSILSFDCHTIEDTRTRQHCLLTQASIRCNHTISKVVKPSDGGLYCDPTWDNIMCWPSYVPSDTRVTQACADYVDGFNPKEHAVRYCTANGTWEIHPDESINTSWTNFHNCRKKTECSIPTIIPKHMPIIVTISTIGYSLSLAFLLVATAIMLGFKKLLCQRNIIHVNLFLSFSLRAVIALIRRGVLEDGVALPKDIKHTDDGSIFFTDGPHWECKLLVTLMHYSLGANYMWIFVEGLYLHNLIFFAVFWQSKRIFRFYIIIGWLSPLLFVVIWVFLRIYLNDAFCWATHTKDLYWILETPIIVSIGVNFIFFLNIIRVLFLKIRDCNTQDPRRYRKLAKSTLVLIPLFGVYYIIFIVMDKYTEPLVVIIHLYSEMILNSFQGTIVSLLFCFLNGEVQGEIKKRWHRHWLRRQSVTSGRSSRAFSTTSFLLRDRASVTHSQMVSDINRLHSNGSTPPRSPSRAHWTQNGHKQQNGDKNSNTHLLHNGSLGMARTSSVPHWSENSTSQASDLPRVASTSKVTFQLADASEINLQNHSTSSLTGNMGNNNKPSLPDGEFQSQNADETIHLLSDNGTKANPSNGMSPRILPYPSSFKKATLAEPFYFRKGETGYGKAKESRDKSSLLARTANEANAKMNAL